TSAVCVTGLAVQDTATYWSGFGQGVILALSQIGGFGIMTGATLLGLLVTRRLRLSTRLIAQAETRSIALGEVAGLLRLIFLVTVSVELAAAAILTLRLRYAFQEPWEQAIWNGLFHAISAFNNAGFSTYSDGMMRFVADPVVIMTVTVAVVLGGLGFPVLYELRRKLRHPARWSIHTKITLLGTAVLLPAGWVAVLAFEWSNPDTLGPLDLTGKLLASMFHSAMTRSGGLNSVDIGKMELETLAVSYVLMLIGGGSASTAGGIRVTTFLLLGFVVLAEIRGEPDTTAFRRRISSEVQRQALSVVLLAVGLVALATLLLLVLTDFALHDVLFEAISACATVGLSTGITPKLPPAAQFVLVVMMFAGRVGTVTIATAFALRMRKRPYRYPEERPIVG
ncbi:MAG TPA: potassium transporter TrkG, partial [Thermomicrobiales bacterium]|nr:potassium transporter TrkG [Thermomicrobiales bacterium]